jgi:hypothetical protein
MEEYLALGTMECNVGDGVKLLSSHSPDTPCWDFGFSCSDFGIVVFHQYVNEQIPAILLKSYLGD